MCRTFIVLVIVSFVCCQKLVEFQTEFGSIEGLELEYTYEFLGIPFGKPPVGDLRFASPQPWNPPSSNYKLDATTYQNACMQPQNGFYEFPGTPSEDCLYLNVYLPLSADPSTSELPVMVWIHGGAFTGGSSTISKYNGTVLAYSHEVIIVTINYRLGALGFLADTSLCDENESCGMLGMLDQQLALHWVQQNIHSFGGNPQNVTIFGFVILSITYRILNTYSIL